MSKRKEIHVYADWQGMNGPKIMGTLRVDVIKSSEVFSFNYNKEWLEFNHFQIDPDLQLYSGDQYLNLD